MTMHLDDAERFLHSNHLRGRRLDPINASVLCYFCIALSISFLGSFDTNLKHTRLSTWRFSWYYSVFGGRSNSEETTAFMCQS